MNACRILEARAFSPARREDESRERKGRLQIPNPKSQIPDLERRLSLIAFAAILLSFSFARTCLPATNESEEEFKLRPPRGEIPASFWEQNAIWVVPLAIAVVISIALLVWYFARPKPPAAMPPEVRVRKELEALAPRPVDRELLSQASQALKRYLAEVFQLPKEEMTTREFCDALSAKPEVGSGLAEQVRGFLRRNDAMKFSPGPVSTNVVAEAINLVETTEARREELRSTQPSTVNAQIQ